MPQSHRSPAFRLPFSAVAAVAAITLASCASHPPARPVPRLVGSISLVNSDLHFALIDSVMTPAPGTPLKALSRDGRETALLNVSPERKQPFIIGNIVEGDPQPGDRVVDIPPVVAPVVAVPKTPTTPAAPAASRRPAAPTPRQK